MGNIRPFAIVRKIWSRDTAKHKSLAASPLSSPSSRRRSESLSETPFDTAQLVEEVGQNEEAAANETVLYLAYGSNLSAETFRGSRGIQPLSQVNVLVPELELTFDLPGLPYMEPCFANTRYRKQAVPTDYHKDRWHKGLVGVVYEVTKADYATIIATEGGGAGYQDVLVKCYEIPPGTKCVDPHPTSVTFKAHTLFAPALPPSKPGMPPLKGGGRISRPDSSYAQASARYLKLIRDGAEEHSLPDDYRSFLSQLRSYTINSARQRLGQFIFMSIWMPIIFAMFAISRLFVDDKGRLPKWMIAITSAVFAGVWVSYDSFFKRLFGDGERTQNRKCDEEAGDTGVSRITEKEPLLSPKIHIVDDKEV